MSLVVLICGTNGVGKTTLVRSLMEDDGRVYEFDGNTYSDNYCFVGKYSVKYGGVDNLNKTSDLHERVSKCLSNRDVVICEGSKLISFGNNLLRAVFAGEKQLIFALVADSEVLSARILGRGGKKGAQANVLKNQKTLLNSVQKWKEIGVPVVVVNTSYLSTTQVKNIVKNKIKDYVELLLKPKMD